MDLTITEAGGSDNRGERADLCAHVDEGLLGPPLTPEKDDVLQQATAVASLRAALMSKNSLLSLKADVLGDDSSLLLEYLPKGAHALSRKCRPSWAARLGSECGKVQQGSGLGQTVAEGVACWFWPSVGGCSALRPR